MGLGFMCGIRGVHIVVNLGGPFCDILYYSVSEVYIMKILHYDTLTLWNFFKSDATFSDVYFALYNVL